MGPTNDNCTKMLHHEVDNDDIVKKKSDDYEEETEELQKDLHVHLPTKHDNKT